MSREGRLRPAVSADTQFFWEGTRRGELLVQACGACGRLRHPPGPACPACHSLAWEERAMSGRGTVYSWVVNHYPAVRGFDGPAVAILVELDEGPRIVSNLVGDAEPRIGLRVQVLFEHQPGGWTVPLFEPQADAT